MIALPAPSNTAPPAVLPLRVSVLLAASTSSVSPLPTRSMPLVPAMPAAAPTQLMVLPVMSSVLPSLACSSPELLTAS